VLWERLSWTAGGFYTREEDPKTTNAWAVVPQTGQVLGLIGHDPGLTHFQEHAAFGTLSYAFSDRFDVQVGGRQSWVDFDEFATSSTGVFSANQIPRNGVSDSVFTYLVSPRYKASEHFMMYARLASGYRPGKSNRPVVVADGAPAGQKPDKATSYEVGVKSDLFDRRLTLDTSVFYIDWQDVQLSLLSPRSFSYGANAAAARSTGIELSAAWNPIDRLTVEGWVAYTDAVLTENIPANATVFGLDGASLPQTAKRSAYLSVREEFPLWSGATGYVGGDASYTGERLDVFTRTPQRRALPGFAKVDFRAGAEIEDWRFNLFVNNVSDKRGLIGFGEVSTLTTVHTYIQPRTYGVNLSKVF
jgi:outer membrane receptor protein involved in Fe transport